MMQRVWLTSGMAIQSSELGKSQLEMISVSVWGSCVELERSRICRVLGIFVWQLCN